MLIALLSQPRPPQVFRPRMGEGRVRGSFENHGRGNRSIVLLSCLAMLVISSSALGSGNISVVLKAEAQVRASEILLSDVSDFRGPDQARLAELARVSLGPAPQAGLTRTLSADQVREQIRKVISGDSDIVLSGAPMVQVRLRCRPVAAQEVAPLVKAHVLRSTPWREEEIEIRSIGHLEGLEVPFGEVSFRISADAPLSHSRTQLLPLEVLLEGRAVQSAWITADIVIKADLVQALRKLSYGKALSAEDAAERPTEIVDVLGSYIRKYEDVAGLVLRRTLSPGDPLTREALTNPVVIRSGDTVNLRVRRGGISLAILARAEQSGKLGQTIRVRSLDYLQFLKAQVIAPGEVELRQEK